MEMNKSQDWNMILMIRKRDLSQYDGMVISTYCKEKYLSIERSKKTYKYTF